MHYEKANEFGENGDKWPNKRRACSKIEESIRILSMTQDRMADGKD